MDFHDAWWWLLEHPAFKSDEHGLRGDFSTSLDVCVVKVNPETGMQEQPADDPRNTRVEVWLEAGRWLSKEEIEAEMAGNKMPDYFAGQHMHDTDLDCGGETFEEAIVEMARLVRQKYGDYVSQGGI